MVLRYLAVIAVISCAIVPEVQAKPWGPAHGPAYAQAWGGGPWRADLYYRGGPDAWRSGRWVYAPHAGYTGWWWIVGDSWFLYENRLDAYPDMYVQPVVVVTEGQAPVIYRTVPATTTSVVTTAPVPLAPSSGVSSSGVSSSGAVVKFKDSAPQEIEATQASSTYIDAQGRTCRDYATSVTIGAEQKPAKGKACLEPDGAWRVVNGGVK